MSRNRNRRPRPVTTATPPPAVAEVVALRVADLGPQHLGLRIEVADRYDGMVGPAGGTLVGYRPSEPPQGYREDTAQWRKLLIAQGPGKGEAPIVREADTVRIAR